MISKEKGQFIQKYDGFINWNVGILSERLHMKYMYTLINMCKRYNLINPINMIHGSFPSKFNGGRISFSHEQYTNDDIKKEIKFFNDNKIGVKLTFSNHEISKKDFDDKEMRFYLDTLSENPNVRNGIICQVDEFAEFLKKEYPQLEITASFCKHEFETIPGKTDTVDYYNKLFDLYDIVVINTFRAYDDEFLSNLKFTKDRVEFIVNHQCKPNCTLARQHHILSAELGKIYYNINKNERISQNLLNRKKIDKKLDIICDKCLKNKSFEDIKINFLNKEEINYLLTKYGINIFKIEGRDCNIENFLYYTNKYLFNPESNFEKLFIDYHYEYKNSIDMMIYGNYN